MFVTAVFKPFKRRELYLKVSLILKNLPPSVFMNVKRNVIPFVLGFVSKNGITFRFTFIIQFSILHRIVPLKYYRINPLFQKGY
jgi:hypothetical protein